MLLIGTHLLLGEKTHAALRMTRLRFEAELYITEPHVADCSIDAKNSSVSWLLEPCFPEYVDAKSLPSGICSP